MKEVEETRGWKAHEKNLEFLDDFHDIYDL